MPRCCGERGPNANWDDLLAHNCRLGHRSNSTDKKVSGTEQFIGRYFTGLKNFASRILNNFA